MALASKVINQTGAIREFEKPEVCEAIKVANANKWTVGLSPIEWDEREARLKEEYEKDSKAPGPGEEQPKEKKGFIYPKTFPKTDFLNDAYPAFKEAAYQFNDSLLDEQAKKIAEFTKKNVRLGEEIVRLNKAIYKKNMKIEELRKESSRHLRGKIKMFGENMDLEGKLKDKDAVLSVVAEELRLSKIREKNLTEVGQKYMKEVEDLREKLANKVVDKIDAQALKSAESALAWKEKVLAYKDMALAYYEKKITNLGKELKAQKDLVDDISLKYDGAKYNLKLRMDECEKLKKELEKMTKLVETVRKGSKEYVDYGIAAKKMIQKMAKVIVNEGPVSSEDFKEYRRLANGGIFMPEISEEELMKLQEKVCVDVAEEGKDIYGVIVLCGKDFIDAIKKMK